MTHRVLEPEGWRRPSGYANGILAEGRLLFLAGQIGWNAEERFEARDLVGQVRQALMNCRTLLAEGGAGPEHLVRLTWYVLDRKDYQARRREIGAVYREVLGRVFPTMTLVEVAGLLEPDALVEIEATAVVPK